MRRRLRHEETQGGTVEGKLPISTSLSAMACLGLLCDSPNDIRDHLEQLSEEEVSTKESEHERK